ncbi:MAG: GlsB/YeaQ/YmgE family stress response membrane protein [Rhodocyclaceae bacterium]
MDFVWFVVVGLVAGWLAGVLVKGSGWGILGDVCVGVAGALIGGLLFKLLRIGMGGFIGNIIVATIGAVILIFILRMFKRG